FEIHVEGSKIAVIDSNHVKTVVERAIQFFVVMNFAQYIQSHAPDDRMQFAQLVIIQRCNDQQDGVGTIGTCLEHLELIHDEILTQTRDGHYGGGNAQIVQRALKVLFLCEDRQRRRATLQ